MRTVENNIKNRLAIMVSKLHFYRHFIKDQFYLKTVQTPLTLFVFITSKCNARCKHCFYWKDLSSNQDMDLENFKKIISSLKNRLHSLILTGGEPTLHTQLMDFIEFAIHINRPKNIAIPTNGILVDRILDLASKLCKLYPKINFNFSFSIDGLEDLHDEIRGYKGSFEKVMHSLKKIKEIKLKYGFKNLDLNIVTSVGKHNYIQLDDLFSYIKRNIDVNHKIQLVRGSKTGVFGIDKRLISEFNPIISTDYSKETIDDLRRTILQIQDKYNLPESQRMKLKIQLDTLDKHCNNLKCVAGIIDGVIYQNGDVSICEMLKSIANLKDYNYDFNVLWNSEKVRAYVKNLKCSCIHNCNIVSNIRYDFNLHKKIWEGDTLAKCARPPH